MTHPILYSFRRCPYAMRARLAVQSAGIACDLREIVLRDKAHEFLTASPKGTVPVVVTANTVIEESLDVMTWALGQNDPEGWLDMPQDGWNWIDRWDKAFKPQLDRTKYPNRYIGEDVSTYRNAADAHLADLNGAIKGPFLFGPDPKIADFAMLPFVRQFAFIDKPQFDARPWPKIHAWLDNFLASSRFEQIMEKYPMWVQGDPVTVFPTSAQT
ncbi:MAG: glutathione S-transferase [Pseudomonadota bacterium]